ncbi:MAG: hypothetical protein WCD37_11610 [Chloroflexia bacterium]
MNKTYAILNYLSSKQRLRTGSILLSIIAGIVLSFLIPLLLPTLSSVIAAPAQTLLIAPIISSQDDGVPPNTHTYIVFHNSTVNFTYQAGDFVTLYTCTDDTCTSLATTIVADDAIRLSVDESQLEPLQLKRLV